MNRFKMSFPNGQIKGSSMDIESPIQTTIVMKTGLVIYDEK